MKNYIFLIALLFISIKINAATTMIEKNALTISGHLEQNDYLGLVEKIKKNKIKIVIFEDCYGGYALTGVNLSLYIFNNDIKTIASRDVYSACSIAYLGGKKRNFTKTDYTLLMIHGLRGQINSTTSREKGNEMMIDFFQSILKINLSQNVINVIKKTKKINEGIYFYQENNKNALRKIYYCDPDDDDVKKVEVFMSKCNIVKGMSFEEESLIKE